MNFKEILHNTLSVQSKTGQTEMMNNYIKRFVKKIPEASLRFDMGNIYITKGEADVYPCIIAHTDTVHSILSKFAVLKQDGVYFAWDGSQQVGVGGDDKVGIALALWFLQEKPNMKIAFFKDEEIGCKGSTHADMQFFDDVAFVLQADRMNYSDVVSSIMGVKLFGEEFTDAITPFVEKYGRTIGTGGMTDVWKLRNKGLEVASMNMSCGYYRPHSDREIVLEDHVLLTRDFINDMIEACGHKRWVFEEEVQSVYALSTHSRFTPKVLSDSEEEEEDEDDLEDNFFASYGYDSDFKDSVTIDLCEECGQHGSVIWDTTEHRLFCMVCQTHIGEELDHIDRMYNSY